MPRSVAQTRRDRRLAAVDDTAAYMGISRRKVWQLAARGELRRVVLGPRCTRFDLNEVDAFIEASKA